MITCKNCNNHFEGKYCNNCGQSADTERLDFKFLIKNLHKNFIKYFHKGIFYTSRQLFTRPGHSILIKDIEGKRIQHFEPIGLLLTFAAFYAVLYHTFDINMFSGLSDNTLDGKLDFKKREQLDHRSFCRGNSSFRSGLFDGFVFIVQGTGL